MAKEGLYLGHVVSTGAKVSFNSVMTMGPAFDKNRFT